MLPVWKLITFLVFWNCKFHWRWFVLRKCSLTRCVFCKSQILGCSAGSLKYISLLFQLFIWEFRVYRKVSVVRILLYMCACHEHAHVYLQGISFKELCIWCEVQNYGFRLLTEIYKLVIFTVYIIIWGMNRKYYVNAGLKKW